MAAHFEGAHTVLVLRIVSLTPFIYSTVCGRFLQVPDRWVSYVSFSENRHWMLIKEESRKDWRFHPGGRPGWMTGTLPWREWRHARLSV